MNLHLPRSATSRFETEDILNVKKQFINPQSHKPCMGSVMDSSLGLKMFTSDDIWLTKNQVINLMSYIPTFSGLLPNPENKKDVLWSGRQVFSMILPKVNYYERDDDGEICTLIQKGKFIKGSVSKRMIGTGSRGLIQIIYNDYGPDATKDFLNNIQVLMCHWLKTVGFSVGISDVIPDIITSKKIQDIINETKEDVLQIINDTENTFHLDSPEIVQSEFENKMIGKLNVTRDITGGMAAKNLTDENSIKRMVSISKGSFINISQIMATVGQQAVSNNKSTGRVPDSFEGRPLPHFSKYDYTPDCRGFVGNSYYTGLNAWEFFFHMMCGRQGLIDTAVKSVTGDTDLVIIENKEPKRISIGDWIDNHLEENKDKILYHDETEANMELLDIKDKNVYIPTTSNQGKMSWEKITKITRHDPSEFIYNVKTKYGRSVKVVKSKSLLIWNGKEYEPKDMKEVKIGDKVPVSINFQNNMNQIDHINMEKYLPKSEYIYGTDFNIAKNIIKDNNESENNRIKFPRFWWRNNNGKLFTLPYSNTHKMIRVIGRSNIENIKDECVYPYGAKRNDIMIEDKFLLNKENGFFIGLYLAEGNSHIKSGKVCIANNDEKILSIVRNWFDQRNIKHKTYIKESIGLSTTIQGYSTILAKFLNMFVGKGARNKFIPSEFFLAPDDFITGLLDGYYSGDGTISKNSIDVSSTSKNLIEGISMLLSRFGIFSNMSISILNKNNFGTEDMAPINRLSIRSKFAKKFSEIISMTHEDKMLKLQKIKASKTILKHQNMYQIQEDTILDEIVEIETISSNEYPKVYDLTVPSTKNFGLANGLQVYDTSETGYIQRQLVKILEDMIVQYDHTTRNESSNIVQHLYGGDGMDPCSIERQPIPKYLKDNECFNKTFQYMVDGKLKNKKEFEKLKDLKDIFEKSYYYLESVFLPVNIPRMIKNYTSRVKKSMRTCDMTHTTVYNIINEFCDELDLYPSRNNPILDEINYRATMMLRIMLHMEFSYNKVQKEGICEALLGKMLDDIKEKFYKSIMQPGAAAGILTAQSMGEPTTQLTLNSVDYLDNICIQNKKINFVGKIGDFIESEIKLASKDKIKYLENDTTYVDISDKDYNIVSVDENGKTHMKLIEAVTKHLPGKGGGEKLLKVTTKSGRIVRATKAKSFVARKNNKIIAVSGKELKVGDRLPITVQFPEIERNKELDLSHYLPKNKYLYSSELYKAKRVKEEENAKGIKHWWNKSINKKFIVPYKRSDTCMDALKKKQKYIEGCVYPKNSNRTKHVIPEKMPLDRSFGFFVGAYLAEGGVADKFVHISNNNSDCMDEVTEFLDKYKIGYHIRTKENIRLEGSLSTNLHIHSTLLRDLMYEMCGTGSEHKYIPSFAYTADKEFIKGLLDGYISGDGTISLKEKAILATSISENLLYGIMDLLSVFGIFASKSNPIIVKKNNIGSTNIRPHWTISIRNKYAQRFIDNIKLTEKKKQERNNSFDGHKYPKKCFYDDIIPGIETNTLNGDYRRDELEKILKNNDLNELDKKIIKTAINSEVFFDRIVSIEEVESSHTHVFDFTVKDTKIFGLLGGLMCYDTFHSAGVSSKTQISSGVPRIKELITMSKNPKTPSMVVYFNDKTKDEIDVLKNKLEYTSFSNLLLQSKIYFDPDICDSNIEKDADWLRKDFMMYDEDEYEIDYSMYVIRMEISPAELFERSLSVEYIYNQIMEVHQKRNLHIMFTEENAKNIYMYIRVTKPNTTLKEIKYLETVLLQTKICGITDVTRTFLRKETIEEFEDGTLINKDYYVVDTEGTNLHQTLGLPYVDVEKTYSNNVNEMIEVFGILSGARCLEIEIERVMKTNGIFINNKHIELLARSMTCKGIVLPVNRHGSKKSNRGPLSRASFEETNEQLTKAAIHNEEDTFTGVSSNIILAQLPPIGTGKCELAIDMDKLEEL